MKKTFRAAVTFITISMLILVSGQATPVRAGGVVGNGDPSSCTEAALDAALADGGLVTFNCGAEPLTIILSAEKTISLDTTIDGGNLIRLSGNNSSRHFSIIATASLTLEDIDLVDGQSAVGGGAILNYGTLAISGSYFSGNEADIAGAIWNLGTLNLADSQFYPNYSVDWGGAVVNEGSMTAVNSAFAQNNSTHGGAIVNANNGSILIQGSTFSFNTTSSNGLGGAIYNTGDITIQGSYFISNTAGTGGGGIYNDTLSTLVISESFFLANSNTNGSGGAIFNNADLSISTTYFGTNHVGTNMIGGGIYNTDVGTATIETSTFEGNTATAGGGVYNIGSLTISGVTFTNNSANGPGGGMVNVSNAPIDIINSTFSQNHAVTFGGGLDIDGYANILNSTFYDNVPDGVMNAVAAWVSVKNTILAYNTPNNCHGTGMTSLGNNLDSGTTCDLLGPGDLRETDPKLSLLGDYGGPTLTHALKPGSPAINAGSNDGCPSTDQRGVLRPQLVICDIGAYEYTPAFLWLPTIFR